MFSNIKKLSLIAVAASLTACGGGGDSTAVATTTTTTVTAFPVQSALVYAFTNGLQQTLSVSGTAAAGGMSYPISGALILTLGKATSTTFNSAPALQYTTTIAGAVVVNGQSQSLDTTGTGYLNLQYAPVGSSAAGAYCVATTASAYPATAVAGQTGTVASYTCYADSTKAVRLGSETLTYAASAGSASGALDFKLNDSVYDASNQLLASGSTTYTINSAGVPSISKITIAETLAGVTVNLTAQ